jgi:hypothetical protein
MRAAGPNWTVVQPSRGLRSRWTSVQLDRLCSASDNCRNGDERSVQKGETQAAHHIRDCGCRRNFCGDVLDNARGTACTATHGRYGRLTHRDGRGVASVLA